MERKRRYCIYLAIWREEESTYLVIKPKHSLRSLVSTI